MEVIDCRDCGGTGFIEAGFWPCGTCRGTGAEFLAWETDGDEEEYEDESDP